MIEKLRFENIMCNNYELHNINMTLYEDEILCFVSQSHANRRGLIALLSGQIEPDSGQLYVDGNPVSLSSKHIARACGLAFIYTKSQLVTSMSIYENIFINREGRYFERLHNPKVYISETTRLLNEAGIYGIDPTAPVWRLSPSTRHLIEIVKAISLQIKVLVIDNITEKYTEAEYLTLIKILTKLKQQQISIIFFTNKYNSLFTVADRVSVISNNTITAHIDHKDVSKAELVRYMNKSPADFHVSSPNRSTDENVLQVTNLKTNISKNSISFEVAKGEIFGISVSDWEYGLSLGHALSGISSYSGQIMIDRAVLRMNSPRKTLRCGLGYIPENENGNGVMKSLNLLENITMLLNKKYDHPLGFQNYNIRNYKLFQTLEELDCMDLLDEYEADEPLSHVSRIDQMRINLAKWYCAKPKVLVLMNPLLGFGEVNLPEFYKMIFKMSDAGISLIIISTNLNNLEALCNNIIAHE